MRILHLFSDWKWTGPAEPTLNLAMALSRRGHTVWYACRRPPEGVPQSLLTKAHERGFQPLLDFSLNRYFAPLDLLHDVRRLARFLERHEVDVLHCHLSHDHVVGVLGSMASSRPALVVRTNHRGVPIAHRFGTWLLFQRTDGYVGYSRLAMEADARTLEWDPSRGATIEGSVDLDRFDPSRSRASKRGEFGFASGDVVAGIVARMQRHRRFDLLMEAVSRASREVPSLRLLVVGRGTHQEEVAKRPAARMGLGERVVFGGYRAADYEDALAAIDFKVFLVPGSDGSCRAVREAMAMGKPVIATKRGMLPEIVIDGETGLLVDETPEALSWALVRLSQDAELRRRLGAAARARAVARFSLDDQASAVESFYARLREARGSARILAP
ncbi:MAG: glycosyltransferase family 4 protein [Planctomycetota bacterium]